MDLVVLNSQGQEMGPSQPRPLISQEGLVMFLSAGADNQEVAVWGCRGQETGPPVPHLLEGLISHDGQIGG